MEEMANEKILGTFTVSNKSKQDLFRVHLFEKSVRFDESFAMGLVKNKYIFGEIFEVTKQWYEQKIERNEVFMVILDILKKYEPYISAYYFKKNELDVSGKYVEPLPIDTINNEIDSNLIEEHFNFLKTNKKLITISKKDFEKEIDTNNISNLYLNNYIRKGAEYFCYYLNFEEYEQKCFLLVKNNNVIMGFVKNLDSK